MLESRASVDNFFADSYTEIKEILQSQQGSEPSSPLTHSQDIRIQKRCDSRPQIETPSETERATQTVAKTYNPNINKGNSR